MKIEAVTVCKDYSDFLEHTLPENLPQVDRLVVVTGHDDKKTHALCSRYSVECIQTGLFTDQNDKFNKGLALNLGLGHLRGDGHILHIDADILLPHRFRDMLHRARLNTQNLYGADRVNIYGYEKWQALRDNLSPHYSDRYFVEPPHGHPLGARIIHFEYGYVPIGYFQLWWGPLGKRYSVHQGNAEHTDVLFACQWERNQRVLLPEVIVYHLESEKTPRPMGANWSGRTTPRFGPGDIFEKPKENPETPEKLFKHPYCPTPGDLFKPPKA